MAPSDTRVVLEAVARLTKWKDAHPSKISRAACGDARSRLHEKDSCMSRKEPSSWTSSRRASIRSPTRRGLGDVAPDQVPARSDDPHHHATTWMRAEQALRSNRHRRSRGALAALDSAHEAQSVDSWEEHSRGASFSQTPDGAGRGFSGNLPQASRASRGKDHVFPDCVRTTDRQRHWPWRKAAARAGGHRQLPLRSSFRRSTTCSCTTPDGPYGMPYRKPIRSIADS